ncbi:methyl-accepting chemotaxis protein [Candidatus Riflebacteria bacterium]
MNLKWKITICFATVIMPFAILLINTDLKISEISRMIAKFQDEAHKINIVLKDLSRLKNSSYPTFNISNKLILTLDRLENLFSQAEAWTHEELRLEIEKSKVSFAKSVRLLLKNLPKKEADRARKVKNVFNSLENLDLKFVKKLALDEVIDRSLIEDKIDILRRDVEAIQRENEARHYNGMEDITRFNRDLKNSLLELTRVAYSQIELTKRITFKAGLFFLLVGIILALILGRGIANPIESMTAICQKIAEGDLHEAHNLIRKMKKWGSFSRDESGEMLVATHKMISNLNSLVYRVKNSGELIGYSSREITSSSKNLEETVTKQASSTIEVEATAKSISRITQDLVINMQGVSKVASDTGELAESGRTKLQEMAKANQQIITSSSAISAGFEEIKEKSGRINKIVININKVSEQTNILSLNAAIESEKAGEFGLGFSIIAREMSRLADQIAVYTVEIEKMVTEMDASVIIGFKKLDHFSHEVSLGIEKVKEIGEQLGTIIMQVENLIPQINSINEQMQSQADGAIHITEAIKHLSHSASQISRNLSEFHRATIRLNQTSKGLQSEISNFKITV